MLYLTKTNIHFLKVSTTSADQNAQTPNSLLKTISEVFRITNVFDPCPINPLFDGLNIPWGRVNFVNPPFNDIQNWASKALDEYEKYGKRTIILMPARTHTMYFYELVFCPNNTSIHILTPGVIFLPYNKTFPHPIMLYCIGNFGSFMFPNYIEYHRLQARCVVFNRKANENDVLSWLQSFYGYDFDYINTQVRDSYEMQLSTRSNFLVLLRNNTDCSDKLKEHFDQYPYSFNIIVVLCRYNTRWFEQLVKIASNVLFLVPSLQFSEFGGSRSIIGSCVLEIGHRKNITSQDIQYKDVIVSAKKPAYFWINKLGEHFR